MTYIIILVAGIILGYSLGVLAKSEKPVGTLRVDQSDPDDGPYLFLELETDPREVMRRKYVNLKVLVKDYVSHK